MVEVPSVAAVASAAVSGPGRRAVGVAGGGASGELGLAVSGVGSSAAAPAAAEFPSVGCV